VLDVELLPDLADDVARARSSLTRSLACYRPLGRAIRARRSGVFLHGVHGITPLWANALLKTYAWPGIPVHVANS